MDGNELRRIRILAGWTQEYAARLFRKDRRTWIRWERNISRIPARVVVFMLMKKGDFQHDPSD